MCAGSGKRQCEQVPGQGREQKRPFSSLAGLHVTRGHQPPVLPVPGDLPGEAPVTPREAQDLTRARRGPWRDFFPALRLQALLRAPPPPRDRSLTVANEETGTWPLAREAPSSADSSGGHSSAGPVGHRDEPIRAQGGVSPRTTVVVGDESSPSIPWARRSQA